MRRPVKYKAGKARRNRAIMIAASTVAAVGVIGGTLTAVVYSQRNPSEPPPVVPSVSDTID
ncbi:MAG: hypothetical protein MJ175_02945, partial [Clostridia bacterium]|nr:hypothetical protein [Clostridia bacterium]